MAKLLWPVLLVLAALLAGCGGGGQPRLADNNRLEVTYFFWRLNLPQVGASAQDYYSVSARLWQPQNVPLLSNVLLSIPLADGSFSLPGPLTVPPTDGTNQSGVPIDVYWGSGDAIPDGQPVTVRPGQWKPGYVRPADDLYQYAGTADLDAPAPVAGSYALTGQENLAQSWTVPGAEAMLEAPTITAPAAIAVNSLQPIRVAWNATPNAVGYLVSIEGEKKDGDGNVIRKVAWTSASRPLVYDAVPDCSGDLLPAETREVTAPARIFRGCEALQISVLAQAAPYVDSTTQPTFRLLNGARATNIVVVFEM